MFVVKRSDNNPILIPNKNHYWEEFAAFNLSPIKYSTSRWRGATFYGLYRAISAPDALREPRQISTIGIGKSKDGERFNDRKPFITPVEEWERFGCEDPRVTYFEGNFYTFYTALSQHPPNADSIKIAVAISKDLSKVDSRHLVTPFNAKAMALFPERVNGKIAVIFSAHTDSPPSKMCVRYVDRIEELWDQEGWNKWHEEIDNHVINPKREDRDHIEVGAVPIKTKYGWLFIYSYIQNYFWNDEHNPRIFGIEALLLELNDPTKIIGKTKGPILVPQEHYELSGYVPNVIFPSGALLEGDTLSIYYGSADTTASVARVSFTDLLSSIHPETKEDWFFKRARAMPILMPQGNGWEEKAVFNPAAIELKDKIHILYRAMSSDNTSTMGYAATLDGVNIIEREEQPVYVPREEFENKGVVGGNSGAEDPRLTKIGDRIYMCYTAYNGLGPPRVAITSISEKDFLAKKWNWEKPFLVTPSGFDEKDACLLPEKSKDGYFILHRIGTEICGDFLNKLDFEHNTVKKCIRIIGPRINTWDSEKVGIAAPPIKTEYGWLLLYHGVSHSHSTYRVGAMLLDLDDPGLVLARSVDPILEPEEEYEKNGVVNNVVFPCGVVEREGLLYLYYGGADRVTNVATMKLDVLLGALLRGTKL